MHSGELNGLQLILKHNESKSKAVMCDNKIILCISFYVLQKQSDIILNIFARELMLYLLGIELT